MERRTRRIIVAASGTATLGMVVALGACQVRAPEPSVPQPSSPVPVESAKARTPLPADQEVWVIAKPPIATEEEVEEMIVTANHIRRTDVDLAVVDSIGDVSFDTVYQLGRSVVARGRESPPEAMHDESPAHWDSHHVGTGAMLASFPTRPNGGASQYIPLPLEHTAVEAAIKGYISTVEVNQRFANPFDTKIEAVYLFPLPEKSAVSEFLMVIGDRTIRGILREKEEAEAIYREARRQGYRASLLVQRRPNIFEQKVANIEPGKAIDIDITYFHTLAYKDGWYSFVFPTVVGPRYNPAGYPDPVDAVRRGRGTTGGGTAVEYLRPNERSGHDISIDVSIDAGVEIEDIKASHGVDVTRDGDQTAVVRLENENTIPNRDFVLDFRVAGETLKSNLLTDSDPESGDGYFTLMVIPPLDNNLIPRQAMELVFVIDCSGSMQGRPLHQAKEAVRVALDRLGSDDTFQIIRFSDRASQFGTKPVHASEGNLTGARRYLDAMQADGGTEMINGVRAALDFPHDTSRFRFVTFMTDGYIGNESDILRAVHERIGASRIFSFGVGNSVNRYLMERMADAGRGVVAYLGLDSSAREVMDDFFARVSRPALTDVAIDWGGMAVTDVYPAKLPDLFVGRPLVVTGKFTGDRKPVRVLGTTGGERRTLMTAEDAGGGGDSLARVWARLRIADLANRQTWAGDPYGELGDAIRNTALHYQLVSNYTSFVAVDSSMETSGDHGVTVRQAVPVPDGVRYETTVD